MHSESLFGTKNTLWDETWDKKIPLMLGLELEYRIPIPWKKWYRRNPFLDKTWGKKITLLGLEWECSIPILGKNWYKGNPFLDKNWDKKFGLLGLEWDFLDP